MSALSILRPTDVRVRALFVVSVAVSLGVVTVASLRADPPSYQDRSWEIVFEDDFDGAELDLSKWSLYYPWGRTHNHDAYARSGNVTLENGALVLTAREESFGGKPYTTGVVHTNGKFRARYGYFEASLRMPSSLGSWPAFWMLQDGWPPEIDIMEFPLSDTSQAHNERYRYWWNYHWGTVAEHRSNGSEEWVAPDLTRGFHRYAVEWSPDRMRFYFDGELRGTVTNRDAIDESGAMYMILNYAVGGWPGSPPSWPASGDRYEIDWVRVWQLEEPERFIDLGRVVGGGDGSASGSAPHAGVHPGTGAFSSDLALGSVSPSGGTIDAVASGFIDSVFLFPSDTAVIDRTGTRFTFESGDSHAGSWDLIADRVEPDGPRGFLRLGPKGVFTRGIGMHSSSGLTFDLDALRRRHGARNVAFFSAYAGEGDLQAGGSVRNYAILSDGAGNVLHSRVSGPHTDDGERVELEIPANARFLTLAVGDANDGNGMDHGVFANAFITPGSVLRPELDDAPRDELLVHAGSEWSYLDRSTARSDWMRAGSSSAGWQTGRAELGYGDGDEATVVSFGADEANKRITTYFRQDFEVQRVDDIAELTLRLLRDDGAIVYLNGEEILRSNLPAGEISATTLAVDGVAGSDERLWHLASMDACLLQEGRNRIACEVHQAAPNSSDLSFDLALSVGRAARARDCAGLAFLRGDCNGDGEVGGITDAVFQLAYSFSGGRTPPCLSACDVNGDGAVDGVSDAVYLLQHSFAGGPAPLEPYPACGPSERPTDTSLGCETPRACP